jgi:hypothetical protein
LTLKLPSWAPVWSYKPLTCNILHFKEVYWWMNGHGSEAKLALWRINNTASSIATKLPYGSVVTPSIQHFTNFTCIYDYVISCKIFEHFALQVDPVIEFIQPRSTPFNDSTILAPKLADLPIWWKSNSTPSKTGSSVPDPDQHIFCTI